MDRDFPGYAGTEAAYGAVDVNKRQSPISLAQTTLGDACALVERVEMMVSRLIGSIPEAPSPSAVPQSLKSNAILTELEENAQHTAAKLRRAHEYLDALNRQLP